MSVTALLLAALAVSGYNAPHEATGAPPRIVQMAGKRPAATNPLST